MLNLLVCISAENLSPEIRKVSHLFEKDVHFSRDPPLPLPNFISFRIADCSRDILCNSKEQSREDDPNCRKMGQSCHSGMKCCTGLACNQLVLGMGYSSLRCGRA
ncbi:hypothetical protein CDAR_552262 [Caerostris darwini]|uniref:WAP domain-containing protein n=1 Tax=Caerostris darwini TaxID=1538125 RepID=A0AAV4NLN8_9ARAC|nr:hypothetical protein CDAR_552262 [Caerostris darwini]